MRDITSENLSDIVLEEYRDKTADPRMREIMTGLIKHLHGFVKDVHLTVPEWFQAIQYLTSVGQMCDEQRQEFILLSDTLGVSMLVETINHPKTGLGTESTVMGPFYTPSSKEYPYGANLIQQHVGGAKTLVRGKVTDYQGNPISGATLDVWSAAGEEGSAFYDVQTDDQPKGNLRGLLRSRDDGSYAFITEQPASYPIPMDGPVGDMIRACGRKHMRPAHLHFIVEAGGYDTLCTHVFANGDAYLDSDVVFATKESLIMDFNKCDDADLGKEFGLEAPFQTLDFDIGLMPNK